MKKLLSMLLAIVIASSMFTSAFAANNKPASPATNNYDSSTYNPLGQLSEEECQALLSSEQGEFGNIITPNHFSVTNHIHNITAITSTYVGERDRGVVATAYRSNANATLSYEKGRSISNSYSVSIGFTKNLIDAALGYNVTYSNTETAQYTMEVPAGNAGEIRLYDIYDVTNFDVETAYYSVIEGSYVDLGSEYGTGWAEQWTNFGFQGRLY